MSQSHVIKSDELYCKATFLEDDIFLTVLSGKTGFSGQIDSEKMAQIEEKLAGKFGCVRELAKQAFTASSEQFQLTLEGNQLIWKKCGGKAKLRLAAIDLKVMNLEDAQTEMMDFLLTSSTDSRGKLAKAEAELEQKTKDLKKAKELNKRFAEEKNQCEKQLIEQFLPILNAKKRRIAELEGVPYGDSRSEVPKDEENEFDDSTDEESRGSAGGGGEKRKPAKNQSERAKKSLKLDDGNDDEEEACSDSESLLKD